MQRRVDNEASCMDVCPPEFSFLGSVVRGHHQTDVCAKPFEFGSLTTLWRLQFDLETAGLSKNEVNLRAFDKNVVYEGRIEIDPCNQKWLTTAFSNKVHS
ncbi:unnamed protein product [Angiostrongylus costaricensis]|uniref:LCCL domain-containing protein n=1 Tax=Angiostrongylus costaricensis TaxID=334426 RepID=A0A0R3PIQ3_ANGCS|nr:unnamed protein product [Angiostrongylus costaricensis]